MANERKTWAPISLQGCNRGRFFSGLAPEETFSQSAWPTTLLLRPLPVFCMALMAANDHWAKHALLFPAWFTGKLSDVVGLFFFPLLLVTLWNLIGVFLRMLHSSFAWVATPTLKKLAICIIVTAVLFSALQLVPVAADAYVFYIGRLLGSPVRVTPDVTDLLALAVLVLTWAYGKERIAVLPPGRSYLLRDVQKIKGERQDRVDALRRIIDDVIDLDRSENEIGWARLIEDLADHRESQILDEQLAWLRSSQLDVRC